MNFTQEEILFMLDLIEKKYGFGYSDDEKVAKLQGKLSIWLEMKDREKARTEAK